MVGVIFHFEDNDKNLFSGRPVDVDLWRESMKPLGGDTLIMIDKTKQGLGKGINWPDTETKFEYFTSLEEAEAAHAGATFIYTESPNAIPKSVKDQTWLSDFVHPEENVIYVFLSDYSSGVPENDPRKWLKFKTVKGMGCWAIAAMSVILYDRLKKLKIKLD